MLYKYIYGWKKGRKEGRLLNEGRLLKGKEEGRLLNEGKKEGTDRDGL
jgi:hypothetical protein